MTLSSNVIDRLKAEFTSPLLTIDSHTAGEPTRLIVGGLEPVEGKTMQEKRTYFMENYDQIRLQLTREPRGHRDMVAAVLTDPVSKDAHFGLIYMDARRYPYLCGHATVGAVTTLIDSGVLQTRGEKATVVVDTPSGPMETVARTKDGKVASVAVRMVPSFVHGANEVLEVPRLGEILVDTVCVGGFFAMVSVDQIGLELTPENTARLIELGMTIIETANRQLKVRHPTRPEVRTVDVAEFYDASGHGRGLGKNAVVYGEAHMDRSPCGTGTAAKMTLLHQRGEIDFNQPFRNLSPLGSAFDARVVEETRIGDRMGVVVEVRGSAHITGFHEFVVDPQDPFPKGFLL